MINDYSIDKSSFYFQNLIYRGKQTEFLIERLSQSTKTEEVEIASFIRDWFNPKPHITVFTSGSTGRAKEIKLSKKSMVNSAKKTIAYFNLAPKQTILLTLPVRFIAGKMMVVRALVGNLNLLLTSVNTTPFKDVCHPFHFTAIVPNQLESFLKFDKELQPACKVLLGGGKISNYLLAKLSQSSSKFYQSYAMTETASHVAIRELNNDGKELPFSALPGIKFSTNKENCLVIHSDFLDQSIYETTDVVKLLSATQFIWLGRADHIINSGGLKINPEVLEQKLEKLIHQRFFIAKKQDDVLGEKVVLVLEGNKIESQEKLLKARMAKILQKHEMPQELIYKPRFSETPTGKIIREI